jgi:hypothetical protein
MRSTKPQPSQWELFEWRLYQEWASELGVAFDDVQRQAGVKPASEGSRASKWRAEQGGAPRVRRAVYGQLVALEKKAPSPTRLGAIAMGVEEWLQLGQQLAMADAKSFLQKLQEARQAVADATGRPVVGARPKKRPARAIARAHAQVPDLDSRAGDETPAEIAMRKRKQS